MRIEAVIAGLDSAIHRLRKTFFVKEMDARVVSAFTRVFDALCPAHDQPGTADLSDAPAWTCRTITKNPFFLP